MFPVIILAIVGILTLILGLTESRKSALTLVLIGVLAAFGLNIAYWNQPATYFNQMIGDSNFSIALGGVILLATGLVFILAYRYYEAEIAHKADMYALILFSTIGALLMVNYENLSILFLGVEILSIPLYVLAASHKTDEKSKEAGLKYFLMGAFTSGFLLLGIALIFGVADSFDLQQINAYMLENGYKDPLMTLGLFMLLVGLFFKIALAPFHFWAPDVYEGSPTLITAFMSTVVKIAAIGALYKIMVAMTVPNTWGVALSALLVLTLIVSNLSAINQKGFKRILAYSSISNAGLLMIPFLELTPETPNALYYYLLVYTIGNIAAFTVYMAAKENTLSDDISSLAGLLKSDASAGIAMLIAMLSLAGIPPLAGFMGKFFIIKQAVESHHVAVALFAVLASLVGIYYYSKIAIIALFHESKTNFVIFPTYKLVMWICSALLIILGLFPGFFMNLLK